VSQRSSVQQEIIPVHHASSSRSAPVESSRTVTTGALGCAAGTEEQRQHITPSAHAAATLENDKHTSTEGEGAAAHH
jgi:hypothetical protein